MDLHLHGAVPTDEEREAVDALLGAPTSAWDGGDRGSARDAHTATGGRGQREMRHLLLPALQALQSRVGWISESGLEYVCLRLGVPPADAWGVATFYALLSTTPRPRRVLHVCDDVVCRCKGAKEIIADLEERVGPAHTHGPSGDHVAIRDDDVVWMRSPCLGLCDQAPAGFVQQAGERPAEISIGKLSSAESIALCRPHEGNGSRRTQGPDQILGALRSLMNTSGNIPTTIIPQQGQPSLRLLKRIGVVDPTSIDAYRASGGFDALRKAIEMGPEAVIREVTESRLMGRGGAAFPTGRKWDAVAKQPARPHYLICNADESEPGTFKDRELLDGDPFAIVEAMTIGGFATGCDRGFLYIRGEYPLGAERFQNAIDQARSHGFLGENILGRGIGFDIEIRRGGGAYICGEETAIFNSSEG